jgi:hypothetical protein
MRPAGAPFRRSRKKGLRCGQPACASGNVTVMRSDRNGAVQLFSTPVTDPRSDRSGVERHRYEVWVQDTGSGIVPGPAPYSTILSPGARSSSGATRLAIAEHRSGARAYRRERAGKGRSIHDRAATHVSRHCDSFTVVHPLMSCQRDEHVLEVASRSTDTSKTCLGPHWQSTPPCDRPP